jgi:hypothetical protein
MATQTRRYKCVNPACADDGRDHQMTVEHNHKPSCDKCRSAKAVYEMANICLLRENPDGAIIGDKGVRYASVCGKFSMPTNPNVPQAFTGEVIATNCPHCLAIISKESSEGGVT